MFDREWLAAFLVIRHFCFALEGREFQLQMDHKPLVAAISRLSPPWTDRQQRQLAYIAEFAVSPLHVPGIDNTVADALSRPPVVIPAQESTRLAPTAASPPAAGGTAEPPLLSWWSWTSSSRSLCQRWGSRRRQQLT